jgi:membrane associated rhomboid family serine protease
MNEKQKFFQSLIFPSFFLLLIWLVKIAETILDINLVYLGIFPLKWNGLIGILSAPLIHSDFKHLIDNSLPVFFLSLAIFYFYKPVAFKVFFYTWFITGLAVWIGGRSAYHIGASGLIYGFASFLFFSGIIRKNINLLAISLLVVFLYGGLVWGIFPFDYKISWESHLFGALTGVILAFVFKKYGPPPLKEMPEEDDEEEGIEYNDDMFIP